jgi:hypothetical protein
MKAMDLDKQFDKGGDISQCLDLTRAKRANQGQQRVKIKYQVKQDDVDYAMARSVWDLGNDQLYCLCKAYPKHDRPDAIVAKIWLIGRSYAAAIERRRNGTDSSDHFYENTVVQKIKKSRLDYWLAGLPDQMADPWKELGLVVSVHMRLTKLFSGITGLAKRSLASKYLHFHRRDLFFIYDARAAHAISKVTPSIRRVPEIKCRESDREYLAHVRRCQWLRDDVAQRFRARLTPRQVDKILLRIADR